ncbi:MAG: epoxyqueuosine reductase QueH [Desulfobulbaceae bacterium]|nr:epoxyqueuosine reductase QueH [Desulfobulbaceae bacterium]
MRILVHVCCGPCAIYPMQRLLTAGHEITGFFHNPNIHPYQEFRRRLETAVSLSRLAGWPLQVDERYGLREYLHQVVFATDNRCRHCYDMRLQHIAAQAKAKGFDAFTTTLLYSKYQSHELICERATWWAAQYQVGWYYEDFRLGWQEGIDASVRMGLYRQPYCGCIYSEQERYDKSLRKSRKKPVQKVTAPK